MLLFACRRTSDFSVVGRERKAGHILEFQMRGGPPHRPNHSGRRPSGRAYRPGDTIRQSGIYEVLHDQEHREAHEAVMISGEKFPDCETCKEKVRFRLVRTAPYIFQDEDFEDDNV